MARSVASQLVPLVILLLVVAGIGFVCYQIYVGAAKIRENAENSFASRNVVFTKDGVKVGVRDVDNERYVDATQSWVVKAWNAGSTANNNTNKINIDKHATVKTVKKRRAA